MESSENERQSGQLRHLVQFSSAIIYSRPSIGEGLGGAVIQRRLRPGLAFKELTAWCRSQKGKNFPHTVGGESANVGMKGLLREHGKGGVVQLLGLRGRTGCQGYAERHTLV